MAKNNDITKIREGSPEPLDLSAVRAGERINRAEKISGEKSREFSGGEDDGRKSAGGKKNERLLSEFTKAYRSVTIGGDNSMAEELEKLERRIHKSGIGEEISRIVGMVDRERIPPLPPVEKDEPRNEKSEEVVIPPAPVILESRENPQPVPPTKEEEIHNMSLSQRTSVVVESEDQELEDLRSQFAGAYRRFLVENKRLNPEEFTVLSNQVVDLSKKIRGFAGGDFAIKEVTDFIDKELWSLDSPAKLKEIHDEVINKNKKEAEPELPLVLENKENPQPVPVVKKEEVRRIKRGPSLNTVEDIKYELFNLYLNHLPEIEKGGEGLTEEVARRLMFLKKQLTEAGGSPEELKLKAREIYSNPEEHVSEGIKKAAESAKQELFEAEKIRLEEFRKQGNNSSESLTEFGKARKNFFEALKNTRQRIVSDDMIHRDVDKEIALFDKKIIRENLLRGDLAGDEVFFGEVRRGKSLTKKDSKGSKLDTDTLKLEEEDYLKRHPKESAVKNKRKNKKNGVVAEPPVNLPIVNETTEASIVSTEPVLDSGTQEQINGLWKDYESEEQKKEITRLWDLYLEDEAIERARLAALPQEPKAAPIEEVPAPQSNEEDLVELFRRRYDNSSQQLNKEKISELEFDKARAEYLKIYGEHKKKQTQRVNFLRAKILGRKTKENEIPEDLREAELAYKTARKEYAKNLYDKEKEDLRGEIRPREFDGTKEEYVDSELAKYRTELFGKFFLEERDILQHKQMETFPPRERSLVGKLWQRWMGLDKYTRLAITSVVFGTVSGLITGGAAPAAILLGIGNRLRRGARGFAGAAGSGFLAQKGIEKYYGNTLKEEKKTGEEKFAEEFNPEDFGASEEKYEAFLQKLQKRKNIEAYVQIGAAIAGGTFATAGVDLIEKNWFSSGGGPAARDIISQTKKTGGVKLPDSSGNEAAFRAVGIADSAPKGAGQAAAETAKEFESIKIKKGQGAWNPVHELLKNQLEKDPEAFLKRINLKINPEELKAPGAAEKILNRETLRLLNEQGYMEGGETLKGISKAGVEVSLDADNKIIMTGEGKTTYDFPKSEAVGAAEPEVDGLKLFHGHESVPDGQESATASVIEESRIGREPDIYSPDVPVEGAEALVSAQGAIESPVAIVVPELPNFPSIGQKENYLNKIFGANDGFFKDEKIPELAKVIKSERLTVGDIDKYVSAKGATPLPERALHNLKEYFKVIADDNFPLQEKLQAMRGIRGSFQIMRMQMGFARAGF